MRNKTVNEIKFGERVMALLPAQFVEIRRQTGLDSLTLQKTLADLSKHGHAMKHHEDWVRC